ncbi:MAG TPA: hypothetical protein VME01_07540 [Solirubrobacteraceae bacterium]|nr:hypothetical protein [Solirubrobacteraceae bacterium]
MSAVSDPRTVRMRRLRPRMGGMQASRPSPAALWPLVGLVVMGALLPLRSNWGAAVVLIALAFTVPGVLALRAMRIPATSVAEFPVYIPAASLLVIMFSGLGCDLIGPSLGIAKPLHGVSTAIATLGVSAVLWLIGMGAPAAARLPWRGILQRPSLLAPLVLPVLSALGALLLTNGHGSTVARVGSAVDVAALLFCLVLAPRLSRGQVAMLLFSCVLAAEWAFSLRSQEVVGFDISTEIYVAQHTQALGVWHSTHHNDAYGAMLSITVLPSTIAALTGCSPLVAFKALYPILTALIPLSIFFVGERFLSRRFAAGAAVLLIVQSYFFQLLPELARQEIALVFFAALLAVLSDLKLRRWPQCALTLAMCAGLISSHYSSTYLAIPVVILAFLVNAALSRWRRVRFICVPLLCAAIALTGGAVLWYGVVTHSASNLTSFVTTLQDQGLNLLPESGGGVVNSYLNGNNTKSVTAAQLEQAAVKAYRAQAPYIRPLAAASQPQYALRAAAVRYPPTRAPTAARGVTAFVTIFNELMLLLVALGPIVMVLARRTSAQVMRIGVLAVGTLAFLAFIRFSGTAAAEYNQTRALLQSLIILALPAAWLGERLWALTRRLRGAVWVVLALGASLMFASQTGATALALGGGTSLNLSSSGEDYERFYMTPAELSGATWANAASRESILYSDRYGQLRLSAASGRYALNYLMPETIDHYAWVYASRTNVQLHRARAQVGNVSGIYAWPGAFLNRYFNIVYDNGDSEVFHR